MVNEYRIFQSKDAIIKYEDIKTRLKQFNNSMKREDTTLEKKSESWADLRELVAQYITEVTDFKIIKENIKSVDFNDQNGITIKFLDLSNDSTVELSINQQSLADLNKKSDLIQ